MASRTGGFINTSTNSSEKLTTLAIIWEGRIVFGFTEILYFVILAF